MPGLVPGIHVFTAYAQAKTWMAGINPAMTGFMMTHHLFVYGTLKHGFSHPMAEMLGRRASYVGPAIFRGRLYLVKHYPGLVTSMDETDIVHGDVFSGCDDALIAELDDYEGCGPDDAQPHQYRRTIQQVMLGGQTIDAWVYLYNWPTEKLTRIPSGKFSPGT